MLADALPAGSVDVHSVLYARPGALATLHITCETSYDWASLSSARKFVDSWDNSRDLRTVSQSRSMYVNDHHSPFPSEESKLVARTLITVVDDLDGKDAGPDGRTIAFSFDGVDYQIDLGVRNATKFEKAIGPFIDAATRVGGRRARAKASVPQAFRHSESSAIRDWARANGFEVSDRGRISTTVLQAWSEAS